MTPCRLTLRISRGAFGLRAAAAAAAFMLVLAGCALQPAQRAGGASAGAVAAPSASQASGFSADLADADDRRSTFDYAWRLVHDRFYDPGFNGIDWDAARSRYLLELEHVRSDSAFYGVMSRMVGELRDSHTRIYTAREYRNRMESVTSTVGLHVADVEGRIAIVEVVPDTPAAAAGLRPGMIVATINGEDAKERLARISRDAPADASPERRHRNVLARMVATKLDGTLTLELRRSPDAAVERVALMRAEHEMPVVVSQRLLEGNIGLIAFNRFRGDAAGDFVRALGRLAHTDGLVIDLRGNPGGSIGAMLTIAQSFFPETRHVLTRRTRIVDDGHADEGDYAPRRPVPEVRISANANAYTKPVAILIDGYTASSSELLATVLREQRGAYVVGRPSCGCVVGVRGAGYRLAGGGALYVAETGFVTPQGNRMEGAGMRPDREVTPVLADLAAGVDRDLVVAQEWLAAQSHRIAEEH